jgi:hypothetical protein
MARPRLVLLAVGVSDGVGVEGKHYATNRKVTGLRPRQVDFSNLQIMALWSTQPLTEMSSTRNLKKETWK